jgi:hypothetical protein
LYVGAVPASRRVTISKPHHGQFVEMPADDASLDVEFTAQFAQVDLLQGWAGAFGSLATSRAATSRRVSPVGRMHTNTPARAHTHSRTPRGEHRHGSVRLIAFHVLSVLSIVQGEHSLLVLMDEQPPLMFPSVISDRSSSFSTPHGPSRTLRSSLTLMTLPRGLENTPGRACRCRLGCAHATTEPDGDTESRECRHTQCALLRCPTRFSLPR